MDTQRRKHQSGNKAVKGNKGAAGIDKMPVEELDGYFAEHGDEIKAQIRAKQYKPQPVRRVYIPKANGKQRPLGIPTVVDRVIPKGNRADSVTWVRAVLQRQQLRVQSEQRLP